MKSRSYRRFAPRTVEDESSAQLRVLTVVKQDSQELPNGLCALFRYNIYALDYGTYVDLMNTSRKPEMGFEETQTSDEREYVVPFDDKRSIRRIILTESILDLGQ